MCRPRSAIRRFFPTFLVVVFLVLTTNAYACVIPLYSWGSATMQACGEPQAPAPDFCEPFKSLGFHAATPKLPPLMLHIQPMVPLDLIVWASGLTASVVSFLAPLEHAPPDLLILISVFRI